MSTDPQATPDGRYLVINGRRWRASDPAIPEPLRQQLVNELMAARRAVRAGAEDDDAVRAARARVQDAKTALGERGEAWWDEPTHDGRHARLAATIRALLRDRAPDATICPSEAARVAAGAAWRDAMTAARDVAAGLVSAGHVEVLQGGESVAPADARGPIRIGRGRDFLSPPRDD